jgi:hypothetical protein
MTAAGIAAAGAVGDRKQQQVRLAGWWTLSSVLHRQLTMIASQDGCSRAAVGVAALKVRRKGGGDAALRRECGGRRSTGESAEGAGVVGTVPEGKGRRQVSHAGRGAAGADAGGAAH